MSLVGFVRTAGSGEQAVFNAIGKSLELIHFDFDRNLKKVVVKPNMCYYYHPSTGEVTDPSFVGVAIDVLRKRLKSTPEIFVVESDASAMKCRHSFRMLGYTKMAKDRNVTLVNLTNERVRNMSVEVNRESFSFGVPELLLEADLLVNIPKVKYMAGAKITCALKNIYGCNAYPKKYVYHKKLPEAIVGINKLIKTNLVLVDGLIVSGRNTVRLGLVLSTTYPVAADVAASRLLGINPKSVKQILLAAREGLGTAEVSFVGDVLQSMGKFPRKTFRDSVREHAASLYLSVFN